MKLLRKLFKAGFGLGALVFWCSLYVLPLIAFGSACLIWTCTWSKWWIIFAAAMGTMQVFLMCLVAAYLSSGYLMQKTGITKFNDYFSRWQQVNVLQNKILEGMYDMMHFIYSEQVRKKEAFEVLMGDLGIKSEDVKVPEGMEDFCKTVKF